MIICAEMSCNHAGDFERAQDIVRAARWAGADAVKLQCWTADTMAPDDGRMAPAPWQHMTLFQLYRQAFTPWEWIEPLQDQIKAAGMLSIVSVFDEEALRFCEQIGGWYCYKIASPEATDTSLVEAVGRTRRRVVISGGSLTVAGLRKACNAAVGAGARAATPCWCVAKYPSDPKEAALRIPKEYFGQSWGLSDHSKGIGVSVAAATLGATYIEKHLTLEKDFPTLDASFSMRPTDFRRLVVAVKQAQEAMAGVEQTLAGMKREGGVRA